MVLSDKEMDFIRNFFTGKPVKRAYLFGSFSRDQATVTSDIDILVELDYSQHIGLGFVKMKRQLEEGLNKKVDLVSEAGVSRYVLPFINKDKKLIYER